MSDFEYSDLRSGLAYGLMLGPFANDNDIIVEVLRLARAANEHFDLLTRAADTWTALEPYDRKNIRKHSDQLYDALGAISTFVSAHRTTAPPERKIDNG
jgi:hypothetical protein